MSHISSYYVFLLLNMKNKMKLCIPELEVVECHECSIRADFIDDDVYPPVLVAAALPLHGPQLDLPFVPSLSRVVVKPT